MQNQILHMIMEKLPGSEGSVLAADVKSTKKEDENDKLWNLLKKTQSQVSALGNEITKVEAENIHQE